MDENPKLKLLGRSYYQELMSHTEKSVWIEDVDAVYDLIDRLNETDTEICADLFDKHPYYLRYCIFGIKILDVNQRTLEMFKVKEKSILTENYNVLYSDSMELFISILVDLSRGKTSFRYPVTNLDFKGDFIDAILEGEIVERNGQNTGLLVLTLEED